jgi:hypothetical protein
MRTSRAWIAWLRWVHDAGNATARSAGGTTAPTLAEGLPRVDDGDFSRTAVMNMR